MELSEIESFFSRSSEVKDIYIKYHSDGYEILNILGFVGVVSTENLEQVIQELFFDNGEELVQDCASKGPGEYLVKCWCESDITEDGLAQPYFYWDFHTVSFSPDE